VRLLGSFAASTHKEVVGGSRGCLWPADGLARLQVRYPAVQVVFADSRKFAEEWSYRFQAAALSDAGGDDPVAE
jgi:hypothetical protein